MYILFEIINYPYDNVFTMADKIKILGAKEHNLKNVSLEIPKDELIVFTGVSGSGKSSLAFDTIFAEGQRRYVESLSTYARQFLGQLDKPNVEYIDGLSPAISIVQLLVQSLKFMTFCVLCMQELVLLTAQNAGEKLNLKHLMKLLIGLWRLVKELKFKF